MNPHVLFFYQRFTTFFEIVENKEKHFCFGHVVWKRFRLTNSRPARVKLWCCDGEKYRKVSGVVITEPRDWVKKLTPQTLVVHVFRVTIMLCNELVAASRKELMNSWWFGKLYFCWVRTNELLSLLNGNNNKRLWVWKHQIFLQLLNSTALEQWIQHLQRALEKTPTMAASQNLQNSKKP